MLNRDRFVGYIFGRMHAGPFGLVSRRPPGNCVNALEGKAYTLPPCILLDAWPRALVHRLCDGPVMQRNQRRADKE